MIELRVQVPSDREIEFYRWFADWREQPASEGRDAEHQRAAIEAAEPIDGLEPATAWWRSLTKNEAAIWTIWIEAAPAMVNAESIVETLHLKGPRDIPGVLAWSGRKGRRAGFKVMWSFRTNPLSGEPTYGIEDVAYADILRRARDGA